MPRNVLLDTNGWVVLLNSADALHQRVAVAWQELGKERCTIVITDWIVAETGNSLARTAARGIFAEAYRRFVESAKARLVFVDSALLEEAIRMYTDRGDKTWGLVDCASFLLMKQEGITDTFTTDRHFEQAGFTCLLPTS